MHLQLFYDYRNHVARFGEIAEYHAGHFLLETHATEVADGALAILALRAITLVLNPPPAGCACL